MSARKSASRRSRRPRKMLRACSGSIGWRRKPGSRERRRHPATKSPSGMREPKFPNTWVVFYVAALDRPSKAGISDMDRLPLSRSKIPCAQAPMRYSLSARTATMPTNRSASRSSEHETGIPHPALPRGHEVLMSDDHKQITVSLKSRPLAGQLVLTSDSGGFRRSPPASLDRRHRGRGGACPS